MTVRDLVATLAVEGAVHHLDLVASLPDQPGPGPQPLALVRRTLEGLVGAPAPAFWEDRTWALIGTGRQPLTPPQRAALGTAADRLHCSADPEIARRADASRRASSGGKRV